MAVEQYSYVFDHVRALSERRAVLFSQSGVARMGQQAQRRAKRRGACSFWKIESQSLKLEVRDSMFEIERMSNYEI